MMKRIIVFMCLLLAAVLPCAAAEAADAAITCPADGVTVREGYSLPVTATVSGAATAVLYVNGSPAENMQISGTTASCVLENMSIGEYTLSVRAETSGGETFLSDAVSVSVKPYGYRRYAWERFDGLTLSEQEMTYNESITVDSALKFTNYYYDTLETDNGRLHIKRTAADGESISAGLFSYATLLYNGGSTESRLGRLGRAGYYAYELEITPMQTNVQFYPLRIAYATSKGSTIFLTEFSAKGRILFLGGDVGGYSAGETYKIRVEFDLENGFADLYINDRRTAAHKSFLPDAGFKNGGSADGKYDGLLSFGTYIAAATGIDSEFYIDNVMLEQYIRPASEEVITVSPDGDIHTISAALAKVGTIGSTIRVMPGEYRENVSVNISGGDYDKLKIIGEEGAVLKGTLSVNGYNVSVQGLTVDGEAKQLFNDEELEKIRTNSYTKAEKTEFASRESAYRTDGVILSGRGCELIGCTVRDVMGTAVSVSGDNAYVADNYISNVGGGIVTGCKNGIIENNEINRINCFYGEGGSGDVFRLFGDNVIIRGNYAHGTAEEDVWHALSKTAAHADFIQSFDDNKTESGNMLIENNIALGFYHQGIMLENDKYGPKGIYCIHDWTVRNNIFSGFSSWGICGGKTNGGIPNMNVYNNIFDGNNAYYGIAMNGINGSGRIYNNIVTAASCILQMGEADVTIRNNALFNYTKNAVSGNVDEAGTLCFGSADDIGFASYTPGLHKNREEVDFHLTAGSPLIDAGVGVDFAEDSQGNARTFGAAADIGPYEYGAQQLPKMPEILSPADGYSIIAGTTVELECSNPDAVFYSDGERIAPCWKPENAGIYTVRAADENGFDEITVTVYPKNRSDIAAGGVTYDGTLKLSVFENAGTIDAYAASYSEDDSALLQAYGEAVAAGGEGVYTLNAPEDICGNIKIFVWTDGQKPAGRAVTVYR